MLRETQMLECLSSDICDGWDRCGSKFTNDLEMTHKKIKLKRSKAEILDQCRVENHCRIEKRVAS